MNNINEITTTVQDQVLQLVKMSQDTMLASAKNLADGAQGMNNAGMQIPSIPGLEQLPTEFVDAPFDFAGKLLKTQHSFMKALAETWAPLLETADSDS